MVRSSALRALVAAGFAGAALLVATTFLAVVEITVGGTSRLAAADTHLTGWERHGPAMALLGAFAAVLAAGAARGARPAMAALAACGLVALGLVLIADLPDLDETGLIGALYAEAKADPGAGWYTETAGAVLLVAAGGGLLLATRGSAAAAAGPARRERSALERIRAHALSLPETSERLSHGAPTFFVREKRAFASFHDGDGPALWCAAPEGAQAALVAEDPERWFVPPSVGSRGWVGMRLDGAAWGDAAEAIEQAYAVRAPAALARGYQR